MIQVWNVLKLFFLMIKNFYCILKGILLHGFAQKR
jgi:hypothetical protein